MQTLKNNKCLTCGGDIILSEDGKHGECCYCHRKYEYESGLTDDKSIIDYEQATEYWHTFRFADAKRKFLDVANANPEFSEAWWGAFVSEYGIEFVTNKFGGQIPTCHRAHTVSVFDDENYKKAIETADDETKETYHSLGEKIETIRKGIIGKSNAGEIYDIFICFKATEVDDERRKTMDYDLGREIYSTLNKEGYRVFFAPETLLQIAEQEYEPHIYRALSTAKVMLLLCSDNREIESAWVKNEWSRFLDIHNGQGLIPICGNKFESYSPNSLPEDLRKLNAIEYNGRLFEQLLTKVHAYFPEIISKGIKVEPTTVDATVVDVENKNNLTTNGKWQFPTSSTMLNFETSTNPEILLLWGNTYYNLGMKENAVRYFTLSAEKGNMEAAFSLGYCYFSGDGVQKDKNKAMDLFKEAATKGYPSAQTFLAKCYLDGDGVDKDSNQAFYWCKKAAEQKDVTAQDMLGTFYQIGIGVNRNIPEAVKWYKKAAMQGNASAQNALGVCYCHGDGITQDYNEAIKWFKKSAAQGNKKAAENLKKTENKKEELNTLSVANTKSADTPSTCNNKKEESNTLSVANTKSTDSSSTRHNKKALNAMSISTETDPQSSFDISDQEIKITTEDKKNELSLKQTLRQQNETYYQNKKQSLKAAETHLQRVIDSQVFKDFVNEFNNQFVDLTVKNIKEFIVSEIRESNQKILHSHSVIKSRYRDFCGELYLSGLSTTWKMLINTEILQAYSELELLTENKIKTVAKYQKYFPCCTFNDLGKLKSLTLGKNRKIKTEISAQLSDSIPEPFKRLQVSNNTKLFLLKLSTELKNEGIKPRLLQYTRNRKHAEYMYDRQPTLNDFTDIVIGKGPQMRLHYDEKYDYDPQSNVSKIVKETKIAYITPGIVRSKPEEECHLGCFSKTKLKKFTPVSKWQRPQERSFKKFICFVGKVLKLIILQEKSDRLIKHPEIILRFKYTY